MHSLSFNVGNEAYPQADLFFDLGSPTLAINNDTVNAYWKSVPNAVRINETNWATPCSAALPDLHFTSPLNGQYQHVIPGSSFMGALAYNVPVLDVEFPSTLRCLLPLRTSPFESSQYRLVYFTAVLSPRDREDGIYLISSRYSVLRRSSGPVLPVWLRSDGRPVLRDPLCGVEFRGTEYTICTAAGSSAGHCCIADKSFLDLLEILLQESRCSRSASRGSLVY